MSQENVELVFGAGVFEVAARPVHSRVMITRSRPIFRDHARCMFDPHPRGIGGGTGLRGQKASPMGAKLGVAGVTFDTFTAGAPSSAGNRW